MKAHYLLLLSVLTVSCHEYEWNASPQPDLADLITPEVDVTTDGTPFNGLLEVYACNYNTSTYYGNYNSSGTLLPVPGNYLFQGDTVTYQYPVKLPLNNFTMVYWGYPNYTTDSTGAAVISPLSIGTNLSTSFFTLQARPNSSYYYPSQFLVYAQQNVLIGTDSLAAQLVPATAMLNVNVGYSNGSIFSSVDSMWVSVNSIAGSLNVYTGQPSNQTNTVTVGLRPNSANTTYSCTNVSLFPSGTEPTMVLNIKLSNGSNYTYTQELSVTLSAGTLSTVTILLQGIFNSTTNPTGFTIASWSSQSDTLNAPTLSRIKMPIISR